MASLKDFSCSFYTVSSNILAIELGFCDNVSTDSVIFKLIQSIFSAWNNKENIKGLFCDLTMAFDSIIHKLLILNFEFYEVKALH